MQSATTNLGAPAAGRERGLLLAGAIAPAAFIGTWVIGMIVSPGGLRLQASDMALGSMGWAMSLLFIATGAAFVAFAFGLYSTLQPGSRVGSILLGIGGLAILGAGIFITDAPGAKETLHGNIHNALFMVTMLALLVSMPFNALKLRRQGWRHGFGIYTIATMVAMPILLGAFLAVGSSPGDPLYPVSGVLELALVGLPFVWVGLVATRLARRAQ